MSGREWEKVGKNKRVRRSDVDLLSSRKEWNRETKSRQKWTGSRSQNLPTKRTNSNKVLIYCIFIVLFYYVHGTFLFWAWPNIHNGTINFV